MTVHPNEAARRSRMWSPAGRAMLRPLIGWTGDGYAPLTRGEVVGAVPAGARRARSQNDYLRGCQEAVAAAAPRSDRARSYMEYARVLARYASWADRSTRPTRARVCREAGFKSVTTYKECRKFFELAGCQATVREGYNPGLRGGTEDPNEAAVYVLCVPLRKRPATRRDCPTARTRPLTGNPPGAVSTREDGSGCQGQEPRERGPANRRTHYRRHAEVIRQGQRQTITEARSAWLARVFARAGWTPADVYFALHHHPADGRYGQPFAKLDNPGAVLAWRLTRWLDHPDAAWKHYQATGRLAGPCRHPDDHTGPQCPADCPGGFAPMPPQSQRELARRRAEQHDAEQRRQADTLRRMAAVEPDAPAASIRAELAAKSPAFARALSRRAR